MSHLKLWYAKLNDPNGDRALWLQFGILSSSNGFRKIAETSAVLFTRQENGETSKAAFKQTHDIKAFSSEDSRIQIGDCKLSPDRTSGMIQSGGRTFEWDLSIVSAQESSFNRIPKSLFRARLVKNIAVTLGEDLCFSGTTRLDGETTEWKSAPGMQRSSSGPKNDHSWVWAHCNTFVNEQGRPAPFLFEGISTQIRLVGPIRTPRLSSFYFRYQGKDYRLNSLWQAIRARSKNTLTEWKFQAEDGDLVFKGHAKAEHRDFAGITYEDTDGSFLYGSNAELSDLTILVYRNGKIETTLKAQGTAAFEVVTRQRNPYVPILI